ncbi:zinc metalloproteinase aureolysin [Wolffia australiana]
MAGRSFSVLRLPRPSEISKIIRKVEQDVETVINVLQPGPLGIIEHKFSASEVTEAKSLVDRAILNWKRNSALAK